MSNNLSLKYTGNPFVDAGIFALKRKLKKPVNEITKDDLKEEALNISDIYVTPAWKKNLYSIFPNNVLVNPKTTKKDNLNELYFNELLTLIESISEVSYNGTCVSCGRRDAVKTFKRDYIPLSGSGSLKNYFSFANEGVEYCSLCAILIQFAPLIMYNCPTYAKNEKKQFLLLHSNSEKVMDYWAKDAINNINKQIIFDNFTGCYNENYTNPINAIFNILDKIINLDDLWGDENPSLTFYYFTNFNKGSELEIFSLPNPIFHFLTKIPLNEYKNWKNIIKKEYNNVKWNKVNDKNDFKNKSNNIYNGLLNNHSILRFFYSSKYKKTYCTWKLVKHYIKEVRNMDEKRIDAIKELGDKLAYYIKDKNSKKTLYNLEKASNYNTFRNTLRKVSKNKISNGDNELLFTFDDYVMYIFPEGNENWKETQDLLLFRIYEKLHDWMVKNKYVEEYEDEFFEEEE
ncbi:type I-B CRISPR-associated protein Cas8b1/Cst1 [Methanobrevibacter woesei]|uniref:type I-B CRISPR-associated protein Cas8b1/Cst1 n=1 Tax=Methanobrevibacter woesei TaxID=190976 RepID=UPI0023548BA5|nr:type I-B CRISPR-associated protein Cas8b1/Cst1 [Methanobrevibacter woesei]